jgi:hypothetical protein
VIGGYSAHHHPNPGLVSAVPTLFPLEPDSRVAGTWRLNVPSVSTAMASDTVPESNRAREYSASPPSAGVCRLPPAGRPRRYIFLVTGGCPALPTGLGVRSRLVIPPVQGNLRNAIPRLSPPNLSGSHGRSQNHPVTGTTLGCCRLVR